MPPPLVRIASCSPRLARKRASVSAAAPFVWPTPDLTGFPAPRENEAGHDLAFYDAALLFETGLLMAAYVALLAALVRRLLAFAEADLGAVLDIEREVELSGPLHSKGVLILSAFLGSCGSSCSPDDCGGGCGGGCGSR